MSAPRRSARREESEPLASVTRLPAHERLAEKKIAEFGLTAEQAERLQIEPLDADDTETIMARHGAKKPLRVASLRLPYFDPEGKPTKFFRLRFLGELPGFAGQVERPQRYWQPPGSLNEVYLPPTLDRPWSEILSDPSVPLYVCEGEGKASCACVRGYPTIGLGGVDVWQSKKRGLELLPALAAAEWNKRPVLIVFDADLRDKPQVQRAQTALAHALTAEGADVKLGNVPPGGPKGLDDLAVADEDAFRRFMDAAPTEFQAFEEGVALRELDAEVLYVRNPGAVFVREAGRLLNPRDFTGHAYANRHFKRRTIDGNGNVKSKELGTATEWLKWPARSEVEGLTYLPGEPRGPVEDQPPGAARPGTYWNTWPGWGVEPWDGGAKGLAEAVRPWRELLDYLFAGADPAHRRWFERWCAYPVQHPGAKLHTAAVIWGPQGTGKTLLGELLAKLYGSNATKITAEGLAARFNAPFKDVQFIHGDEITGDAAGKPRAYANTLKLLITDATIRIEQKFLDSYVQRSCANFYFTSNHLDAFFIEDDDRRMFIHEVTARKLPASQFFERVARWKDGPEIGALFEYLRTLDLGDFDPHARAPETLSKRAMAEVSRSPLDSWCRALRNGEVRIGGCALATATEIADAYKQTHRHETTRERMRAALRKAGFPDARVIKKVVGDSERRLYAVVDAASWEAEDDAAWRRERRAFENKTGAKF